MKNYINQIKALSKKKEFTITLAESCTGGMVSSYLTSIDGSSKFFNGSIISYSNSLKKNILNVPKNTIAKYGSVSHQTALAMVKGIKKMSDSEIIVSITGVAGPKGGNVKTPIGCVYFGIGIKKKSGYRFKTIKKLFKKNNRRTIQRKSSEFVLKTIVAEIKKI